MLVGGGLTSLDPHRTISVYTHSISDFSNMLVSQNIALLISKSYLALICLTTSTKATTDHFSLEIITHRLIVQNST